MTVDALIAEACPKIGHLGRAFYFASGIVARGEELGLDVFHFYFMGRGGVLGDVEAPVVASAFGYFEPSLVESMWESGREVVAPREAGRAYVGCCQELGRERLLGAPLEDFCVAAALISEAASRNAAGLALYAGWAAEPLPDDPPARAMQLLAVLRELRGGAHLIAVLASGLEPVQAHYLARPEMFSTFGWKEDEPPAVTDDDQIRLAQAEELTDRLVAPAYSALDAAGRAALLEGLQRIEVLLAPA